ncbi:MAG: hypothetical protein M0005_17265 [Actinomycetota bacterium]|nr:hypothetical protein [Actinomycetota bacterium]
MTEDLGPPNEENEPSVNDLPAAVPTIARNILSGRVVKTHNNDPPAVLEARIASLAAYDAVTIESGPLCHFGLRRVSREHFAARLHGSSLDETFQQAFPGRALPTPLTLADFEKYARITCQGHIALAYLDDWDVTIIAHAWAGAGGNAKHVAKEVRALANFNVVASFAKRETLKTRKDGGVMEDGNWAAYAGLTVKNAEIDRAEFDRHGGVWKGPKAVRTSLGRIADIASSGWQDPHERPVTKDPSFPVPGLGVIAPASSVVVRSPDGSVREVDAITPALQPPPKLRRTPFNRETSSDDPSLPAPAVSLGACLGLQTPKDFDNARKRLKSQQLRLTNVIRAKRIYDALLMFLSTPEEELAQAPGIGDDDNLYWLVFRALQTRAMQSEDEPGLLWWPPGYSLVGWATQKEVNTYEGRRRDHKAIFIERFLPVLLEFHPNSDQEGDNHGNDPFICSARARGR